VFATDTFSIAVMTFVDNAFMLAVPGAMEVGVGDLPFLGAVSVALVAAGVVAFPVNRWLIESGTGRAVLRERGHHPNFLARLVAIIAAAAAAFGAAVLITEALFSEGDEERPGGVPVVEPGAGQPGRRSQPDPVRGPSATVDGLMLELATMRLSPGEPEQLRFRVVGENGRAVRDFEVEHAKRLHLIVVRDDLRGFQHLHPRMSADGSWSTPVTLREAGSYRVFADFKHQGQNRTLARTVTVEGPAEPLPLPAPAGRATTATGYTVHLSESLGAQGPVLSFHVARDGQTVELQKYLAAKGHLVALRERDLAYVHTHPGRGDGAQGGAHAGHRGAHAGHGATPDGAVPFETAFPSGGRYRLFFQFKHEDRVHTAAFTHQVSG
jgi:hypothetical protein